MEDIKYVTMNELHMSYHIIIKDKPCKITDIYVAKPGKHGSSKAIVTAKDIFT